MPFELTPGHSISKQLHRLARKGLRRAIEGIDRKRVGDAAVHEARKDVKKVRAILKLLRRPLGRRYAGHNNRLRTAARQLSNLRDADAMLQTFASLCASYGATLTPAIQSEIRRRLGVGRELWRHAGNFVQRALRDLRRAERRVPERILESGRASTARRGFVQSYRQARAAMEDLTMASDAATSTAGAVASKTTGIRCACRAPPPDAQRQGANAAASRNRSG